VADFTGRSTEVSLLTDLLTLAVDDGALRAVMVATVAGEAGVGKTALAVHVAHRLRERFPDGQLYVNLCGDEHQPMAPTRCWAGPAGARDRG
jgi:predicted ATPase